MRAMAERIDHPGPIETEAAVLLANNRSFIND